MRVAEPGDSEAVADVFLAAKAQMTYPEIHTKAETRHGSVTLCCAADPSRVGER